MSKQEYEFTATDLSGCTYTQRRFEHQHANMITVTLLTRRHNVMQV